MGGTSKKTGKNRQDKWYRMAKEMHYRARSAFKLIQLNKKYSFLENSRVLVDLCAAPGGWLQVAAKHMPMSHVIIGVDLAPIKPIDGVVTFVSDITTEKCRTELKRELKTWKVDVFLNDGAPNVGAAWAKDAYTQSELVLYALKLASEFLAKDGWFVTKIFRSKDYNSLLWVFGQLFAKVEATKPVSSRNESAEIFVVCKGFLAPKKIDPKFFEPKSVFQEVDDPKSQVINIFQPEKKQRQRQGYEDGATVLFKTATVGDFISSDDPATLLGTFNAMVFAEGDKEYEDNEATTDDIKHAMKDLKVLGRGDFKALLKWRTKLAKPKKEAAAAAKEKVEVEPIDIAEQVDSLAAKLTKTDRKKKKKTLEKKQKERVRMQLGMTVENDIGNNLDQEGLFALKTVKKIEASASMPTVEEDEQFSSEESEDERSDQDSGVEEYDSDDSFDEDMDALLEDQYKQYKQMMIEKNPYLKVKEKYANEKPFTGCEADVSADEFDPERLTMEVDDYKDEVQAEDEDNDNELIMKFDHPSAETKEDMKAAIWYENPLLKDLGIDATPEEEDDNEEASSEDEAPRSRKRQADLGIDMIPTIPSAAKKKAKAADAAAAKLDTDETKIEFVKADAEEFDEDVKNSLLSAEGLTLALKMKAKKAKQHMIDDSFNRYAFSDRQNLPSWFKDDENRHNKPQVPITKEAVNLLKEKMKAINAKPIKKVLEAKGRQKYRAMKKIEAMKKKAAVIADADDITEKQKVSQIQKIMRKKAKPKKEVKLVIGKGANKGAKGRPKGVKGKYKMVDNRLKKDLRADKFAKRRNKRK